MKRRTRWIFLLLLTGVCYLQWGRNVSVRNTISTSLNEGRTEYITIVANKVYIWDKEEFGRRMIANCIDNSFRNVRFSYDVGYPVEIRMEVYTNETTRKLGIKCCDIQYTQDRESGYRYNIKDNPEKFVLTVE